MRQPDGRWEGCDAYKQDNGFGEITILPACMGGAAVEGAAVSIIGCSQPLQCVQMLEYLPDYGVSITVDPQSGKVVSEQRVRVHHSANL